jgi:hypothetical protein
MENIRSFFWFSGNNIYLCTTIRNPHEFQSMMVP